MKEKNEIKNPETDKFIYLKKEKKLYKSKKERNSSFELLRMILMNLIVLHHIFINTYSLKKINICHYKKIILWKYIILKIISNYGQFGNNLFIMISGYFSVSKTAFNEYKFTYFILEVYTYYFPSIFIGKKLSKKYKNLKFPNFSNNKIYFPLLTTNGNWFIQTYLLLLIFMPYINIGLLSLNKKKYKNLVILIIIFYCIFNSLAKIFNFNSKIFETTGLIKLLLPYIIGGYIKIYDLHLEILWLLMSFIYFPLTILSEIFFDILTFKFKTCTFINFHLNISYSMNSILSIIGAMGLIYLFKRIKFYSKTINYLSGSVLGIYLIHGNKNISPYAYNIWLETNNLDNSFFFFKYIIKAILIMGFSLFIDIIRRYTIGIFFDKLIKNIIFILQK